MRASIIQLIGFLVPFLVSTGYAVGQPARSTTDGPTTYFWGIQRGCVRDGYLSAAVENRLRLASNRVVAVGSELVSKNPGCLGEECLRPFNSICTNRNGVLLGGVVVQRAVSQGGSEPVMWQLVRLWRVETASGQTTYLQHACRKCELPRLLPVLTAELLENPPSPSLTAKEMRSARPPFCAGGENQPEPAPPGEQRIAVVVSGIKDSRSSRAPLLRALKEHLAQTGREVVRAVDEGSTHHAPELATFIGKKVPNDVIGVELLAEGQVRVRLLTAATLATSENAADCLGCSDPALAKRVIMTAGPLLDRCSGAQCSPDAMATPLRWPYGICSPSSEPTCRPPEPEVTPASGPPQVNTLCGPIAEAETNPNPPNEPGGDGHKRPPVVPTTALSTGRIVGASLLGAGALAAFITAGILTSKGMQAVDGPCYSADNLLVGACVPPNLAPAYGSAYAAGALLLGGAVVTLWPLFKPSSPKQITVSPVSR